MGNQDLAIVRAGKTHDAMLIAHEIIKNFEMKRTRDQKQDYDTQVMNSYLGILFGIIQNHSDQFMIAFSKPIYHDSMKILENFRIGLSSHIYNLSTSVSANILTGNLKERVNDISMINSEKIDIKWFEENNAPIELIFGSELK